jgi:2-polyprenyl-3-methyl-5-hydroxy-6-metoxy-1,4-benzoquinol methylase
MDTIDRINKDKAGKEFWDAAWAASDRPASVDPLEQGALAHVHRRFHSYFQKSFSGIETRQAKLLEIGCARSLWLPYFAKEFGFEVTGLDYSEPDFFSPPEALLGAFDVVVSFGVAEHFTDTAECLKAFSRFLKPGGLMLTSIPNMTGLPGALAKKINRPVFDVHVPLDAAALRRAHELADLEVLDCSFFMSNNFGVLNLNGIKRGSVGWVFKKIFLAMMVRVSRLIWLAEDHLTGELKARSFTAPYINCIARNP